jgi:hypothetical protein
MAVHVCMSVSVTHGCISYIRNYAYSIASSCGKETPTQEDSKHLSIQLFVCEVQFCRDTSVVGKTATLIFNHFIFNSSSPHPFQRLEEAFLLLLVLLLMTGLFATGGGHTLKFILDHSFLWGTEICSEFAS